MLAQEAAKIRADRDAALQWSNPAIAYDHEELETFSERQIALRKSFVNPLSFSRTREGWADRVRAAELALEQELEDLLAELKTGYVRLQLLDAHLARLVQLEEIVAKTSMAAEARHREGELSGIDRHLIHLSALTLGASRRSALREREETAAKWQAEIGIAAGGKAVLATPITYEPVTLAATEEYLALVERRPGVQSGMALNQALGTQAKAAKPSLVPGFDVYIGYKRVDAATDGWMAGVELSLPLFDRKAGSARRLEAERRMAENALELYRKRSFDEIASLVRLIEDSRRALSPAVFHPNADVSAIGSLLQSYREGRHTLEALLNAIQIVVAGSRAYCDELLAYYENIFRLEAFTGARIVSF